MKKIILLFFVSTLLASCAVHRKAYIKVSNSVDFSEYTRKGFFITESNSVNFEYDPLSSVSVLVESGYEVINKSEKSSFDNIYRYDTNTKYGKFINAKAEDALNELYEKSMEIGADGIINLKINFTPSRISSSGEVLSWDSYYISGMAIKRN